MAGLEKDTPIPTGIVLHQRSKVLEVQYEGKGESDEVASPPRVFRIPFELLRVYSPSAEVQGHGPGQETLQTGKRDVAVNALAAVGHYAIQPTFSDGHDTGIYSWDYLYKLATQHEALWQAYLDRLAAAGQDRDAPMMASRAGHAGRKG